MSGTHSLLFSSNNQDYEHGSDSRKIVEQKSLHHVYEDNEDVYMEVTEHIDIDDQQERIHELQNIVKNNSLWKEDIEKSFSALLYRINKINECGTTLTGRTKQIEKYTNKVEKDMHAIILKNEGNRVEHVHKLEEKFKKQFKKHLDRILTNERRINKNIVEVNKTKKLVKQMAQILELLFRDQRKSKSKKFIKNTTRNNMDNKSRKEQVKSIKMFKKEFINNNNADGKDVESGFDTA